MKLPSLNPYYRSAIVLVGMAGILIGTAILINRNDFTSAMLVVAGLICLLTGIFFTALSGSDPLDLRYMSLLPVQGSITISRICADLGIQGNACIIPSGRDDRDHPMQYLPVAEYHGEPLLQESFVTGTDTSGLLAEPTCAPIYARLRNQDHLVIPGEITALQNLIRELGVEVLEVATRVHATHEEGIVTIVMDDYRLISGCRALYAESPRCCTSSPCPVCSLFAVVLAEGTGTIIQVERCAPDPKQATVTMTFSILRL